MQDLESLFRILHRNEVRFVAVGAFAVGVYGYPRATLDVDIVPDPDPRNLAFLEAVLSQIDARIPSGRRFDPARHSLRLRRGANVTLTTKYGNLDIIQRLEGVPLFSELDARAVDIQLEGIPLRVCSLADLRAMKTAAGRPQDLVDIANLPDA